MKSFFPNNLQTYKGTSINDVPHFSVIFDLPTYPVLLYNVPFLGLFWTPLPTLIRDVINGRSLSMYFELIAVRIEHTENEQV